MLFTCIAVVEGLSGAGRVRRAGPLFRGLVFGELGQVCLLKIQRRPVSQAWCRYDFDRVSPLAVCLTSNGPSKGRSATSRYLSREAMFALQRVARSRHGLVLFPAGFRFPVAGRATYLGRRSAGGPTSSGPMHYIRWPM